MFQKKKSITYINQKNYEKTFITLLISLIGYRL